MEGNIQHVRNYRRFVLQTNWRCVSKIQTLKTLWIKSLLERGSLVDVKSRWHFSCYDFDRSHHDASRVLLRIKTNNRKIFCSIPFSFIRCVIATELLVYFLPANDIITDRASKHARCFLTWCLVPKLFYHGWHGMKRKFWRIAFLAFSSATFTRDDRHNIHLFSDRPMTWFNVFWGISPVFSYKIGTGP